MFGVAESIRKAILSLYDHPIRAIEFLDDNTLLFKMYGRRTIPETREIIRDWFQENGYGDHEISLTGMGLTSLIANRERTEQKVLVDEELYVMLKLAYG